MTNTFFNIYFKVHKDYFITYRGKRTRGDVICFTNISQVFVSITQVEPEVWLHRVEFLIYEDINETHDSFLGKS